VPGRRERAGGRRGVADGRRVPSRRALERIGEAAGAIALRYFRRVVAERKADQTLVTRADREVERWIVRAIGTLMPGAAIVGEEGTARPGTSPGALAVVIDPIDGTAAFVAGLPTWCVCIGILRGDRPVAGVVHLPCSGETYSAVGGTAWWNGQRLRRLTIRRARAGEGDRFVVAHAKAHRRHAVAYPGKVRSLGSTAYHVVLVARGVAEAALLGEAHVWDLAAPGAVLAAVGGRYEYAGGGRVALDALRDGRHAPDEILAGSAAAIRRLRPLLVGRA
jgi:myo-inositol-1(or 4)-monophosphatase